MTSQLDVIRLLHQADWTRLGLSAEVSDGSRVVLAPGGRYRQDGPAGVTGSDGRRWWRSGTAQAGTAQAGTARQGSGLGAPLPTLLSPAWLLRSSRLEVRGHVTTLGREAVHVMASARPSISDTARTMPLPSGRTEAFVDAELGILLRVAWLPGEPAADEPAADEQPDVTELVSLDLDPAADPGQFAPPPGSTVTEGAGTEGAGTEGAGTERTGESAAAAGPWSVARKTAADLAAEGLVAGIRHWPFGRDRTGTEQEDPEAAMPLDGPAPEVAPDGRLAGPGVSDEVLRLLYDSGTAAFTGTLHQRHDAAPMLSYVTESARRGGFGRLGELAAALGERGPAVTRTTSSLRFGGPGRYQVDWLRQRSRSPKTIACDGRRRWKVYDDKITVGPAKPPPFPIGNVADVSWLLECRLAGGALIMAGDRPGYRIEVARGGGAWPLAMFSPAVAVVDAELGILLTLTCYLDGKPALRDELRDVSATRADDFQVEIPPG